MIYGEVFLVMMVIVSDFAIQVKENQTILLQFYDQIARDEVVGVTGKFQVSCLFSRPKITNKWVCNNLLKI